MSSFTLWFASEWLLHRVWGVHFLKNCYFSVLLESLFQYYLEKMNKLNGVFQFKCHQMSLNGSLLLNHRRCERFSEFTVSQPLQRSGCDTSVLFHSSWAGTTSWTTFTWPLTLLFFFFCVKVGSSFPQTSNPWLGGFPQYAADTPVFKRADMRLSIFSYWMKWGREREWNAVRHHTVG